MATKSIKHQNYYEVLQVSPQASEEEIEQAFIHRKHSLQNSSKRSPLSGTEYQKCLSLLERAHGFLKASDSRKAYDLYLSQHHSQYHRSKTSTPPPGGGPAKKAGPPGPSPATKKKLQEQLDCLIASVERFDGPTLKQIRTLKGVSLEALSQESNIRRTYLRYLEEEEFSFLPAPVYIKGFIRIIADCLGLPVERAADDYMVCYHARQKQLGGAS